MLIVADAATGRSLHEFELPGTPVRDGGLTEDGRFAVVANQNGTVYVLALPPPAPSDAGE